MKRINTIVWSNKEPDKNVLWLKGKRLLHFNNDEWTNIIGTNEDLIPATNDKLGMVMGIGTPEYVNNVLGNNKVGIAVDPKGKMYLPYMSGSNLFYYFTIEGRRIYTYMDDTDYGIHFTTGHNVNFDCLKPNFLLQVLNAASYNQWINNYNYLFPLDRTNAPDKSLVTASGLKAALPRMLYVSATDGSWNKALKSNYLQGPYRTLSVYLRAEDFDWHYDDRNDSIYLRSNDSVLPATLHYSGGSVGEDRYGVYLSTFIRGVYTKWRENDQGLFDKIKSISIEDINSTANSAYDKISDYIDYSDSKFENVKKELFIDLWNQACGEFGRYNPETDFFELNELTDITYEEALYIYSCPRVTGKNLIMFNSGARTFIYYSNGRITMTYLSGAFALNQTIETIRLGDENGLKVWAETLYRAFHRCTLLHKIIGVLDLRSCTDVTSAFERCDNLQEVRIVNLHHDITFAESSNLSFESLQYMVTNADNDALAKEVTITVHPDIYAKLTDMDNAEWSLLLADATEKHIMFVTA